MDVMDMRAIITVLSFLCFIGIVIWAYSGHQKARFDEAANLPFADDEMQERTVMPERKQVLKSDHSVAGTGTEVTLG